MNRRLLIPLTPVLLGALPGCVVDPTHLVFSQSAVVGVDISASTEGGPGRASVGYDRYTLAFVPKTRVRETDGTEDTDAMSIISKSKLNVRWYGPQEVHEHFATGDAAIGVARSPEAIQTLGANTQ